MSESKVIAKLKMAAIQIAPVRNTGLMKKLAILYFVVGLSYTTDANAVSSEAREFIEWLNLVWDEPETVTLDFTVKMENGELENVMVVSNVGGIGGCEADLAMYTNTHVSYRGGEIVSQECYKGFAAEYVADLGSHLDIYPANVYVTAGRYYVIIPDVYMIIYRYEKGFFSNDFMSKAACVKLASRFKGAECVGPDEP